MITTGNQILNKSVQLLSRNNNLSMTLNKYNKYRTFLVVFDRVATSSLHIKPNQTKSME